MEFISPVWVKIFFLHFANSNNLNWGKKILIKNVLGKEKLQKSNFISLSYRRQNLVPFTFPGPFPSFDVKCSEIFHDISKKNLNSVSMENNNQTNFMKNLKCHLITKRAWVPGYEKNIFGYKSNIVRNVISLYQVEGQA